MICEVNAQEVPVKGKVEAMVATLLGLGKRIESITNGNTLITNYY